MEILINLLARVKNKLIRLLYLRNPINVSLGQKIYKNDAGFIANLVGNYILKKNRLNKQFNFIVSDKSIIKILMNLSVRALKL